MCLDIFKAISLPVNSLVSKQNIFKTELHNFRIKQAFRNCYLLLHNIFDPFFYYRNIKQDLCLIDFFFLSILFNLLSFFFPHHVQLELVISYLKRVFFQPAPSQFRRHPFDNSFYLSILLKSNHCQLENKKATVLDSADLFITTCFVSWRRRRRRRRRSFVFYPSLCEWWTSREEQG